MPNLDAAKSNAARDTDEKPARVLRVNKEGFYVLKEHKGLRTLRLANRSEEAATRLDPDAMAAARKDGDAIVTIDLHRVAGYNPQLNYLPKKAQRAQIDSIRNAFAAIVAQLGATEAKLMSEFPGIASASFRLTAQGLEKLYGNPDPRIASVYLNKTLMVPMLDNSARQINLPHTQNPPDYGYGAAGQYIAIIDSGVDNDHAFLQNAAAGRSKVIYEACFGTNSATLESQCPDQISYLSGDSPLGRAGSARPLPQGTAHRDHGTHVAGIAAGRRGWSGLTGVAFDADIIAMQVMSKIKGTNLTSTTEEDYLAALNAIAAANLTNVTVNMSIGSDQTGAAGWPPAGGCSGGDETRLNLRDAVAALKSLTIPVVASTGNGGDFGAIAVPACIQEVIKVAAITDTPDNPTFWPDSNIMSPDNMYGPFFLAPGVSINSSVPGCCSAENTGTSMAAPHIAGMYAAVKAAVPGISVDDATNYLQDWGTKYNGKDIAMTVNTFNGPKAFPRAHVPDL